MMICHPAGRPGPASLCAAFCILAALSGTLNAAVTPGDIAIIGYQSDDPDTLAFVVLSPIPAGEIIRFTDSGWKATGGFRANEGGIAFTAATDLSAGAVITHAAPFNSGQWSINNAGVGTGSFLLSTSGDQVLAFQGDATTPAFVYAINADDTGWGDATSSNTTALPTGLVPGTTAVDIGGPPETDNGYYNGITQGTQAQLLAAIGDPANWVTNDNVASWPAWSFTVTTGEPAVTSVSLPSSTFETGAATSVTVHLSAAPSAGSPATVSLASGAFASSPVEITISGPANVGTTDVAMAHNGTWSATATAVSGCAGTAVSTPFVVGSAAVAPMAYAGEDRTIVLSGASVSELMTAATADDVEGLTGLTYAWTPETGSGIVNWTSRTGSVTATTDPSEAQVTISQTGIYTFTLTVTDPHALTAQDSVTVTVINAAPTSNYDPPSDYYDPARPGGTWYTGAALKNALHNIIGPHTIRSYDAAKSALQLLDEDPDNASNLILIYTGVSVPKPWDAGVTWNREHIWPDSLNPGGACDSDLFNLRPCNPNVNSSRGNKPFGIGTGYWDPNQGASDRGRAARALFYMATCYTDLTLVEGLPGSNEMGDLARLLVWHYESPADLQERRRNHLIHSSTDNPSYYQGNRNPFVDHPELVWTIWGAGANDSKLYLGDTAPSDGSSSVTVNLGAVIKGAPMPSPQAVTLRKSGDDPTTFDVIGAGDAVSPSIAPRQAFAEGPASRSISAGLSSSTLIPGAKQGGIIIDNTDLTSAGTGTGSTDGNDTISVSAEVREHALASFASHTDQRTLTIDFGTLPPGTGPHTRNFTVYNLATVPGFTAGLDLDAVQPSGDTGVAFTDAAPFANLVAGGAVTFNASFDAGAAAGTYEARYNLVVSDEDLPGAQAGAPLVLTVVGAVGGHSEADLDGDGDVDLIDFSMFQACFNGPNRAATPACTSDADLDNDTDVDLLDFAELQGCFNGPNRPPVCL